MVTRCNTLWSELPVESRLCGQDLGPYRAGQHVLTISQSQNCANPCDPCNPYKKVCEIIE